MKSFNVLERSQEVHRSAILEASAGTGKTFSIENIVVRLLIDQGMRNEPFSLERILIVTFTRAATSDLKVRIRANLEESLDALKKCLTDDNDLEHLPDFLLAHVELGHEAVLQARRRIEHALFLFDQAQIFTIHGFCWRMLRTFALEGNVSLDSACSEDESLSKTRLLQAVRDFLRTELVTEAYTPQQIKIVLKKFSGQSEKLQSELLKALSRGIRILPPPAFGEQFEKFQIAMASLKKIHAFESEKMIADFLVFVPSYRGLSNRSKQLHPEVLDKVRRFSLLFDKENWTVEDFDLLIRDGLFIVDALAPSQLTAKGAIPASSLLYYPHLLEVIDFSLRDIIDQVRDENLIFSRMASDCQKFITNFQNQEEMLGFNDLLHQMLEAIANPLFAEKVRSNFDVAIVDEFQDTDPIQWEIFRALFADSKSFWKGFLYLVGDPKQSIYAFRQADIYTYLSAAKALGQEACSTLDTNFRSQPSLVNALNVLFDSAQKLFPLPQQQSCLPYRRVKAGVTEDKKFSDGGACVQFLLAQDFSEKKRKILLQDYEERFFFPAIANEIIRLNREDGVRFSQFAVLVADRFQADRLTRFFKSLDISVISQRGINLAESMAVPVMRELLRGILNYRHASSLRIALGGRVIGMTHQEIIALDDEVVLEKILERSECLRNVLIFEGISYFYPRLMHSSWHPDGKSVLQRLLLQQGGAEFYREWQDLADLLIEVQFQKNLSAEGLIAFLDELPTLAVNEDERLTLARDHEEDGVQILTSHVSKGLEFDIVFALGLIKRPTQTEALIPVKYPQGVFLEAMKNKKESIYRNYCEEIDAEKMRQLYVAMTRAKSRLYLPVAIANEGARIELGGASPMELFLARLGQEKASEIKMGYEDLYDRINAFDGTSLSHFVDGCQADISLTFLKESPCRLSYKQLPTAHPLIAPPEVNLPKTLIFVESFTSLARVKIQQGVLEQEFAVPHEYNSEQKTAHTLPAGSDTGTLLHTLFEVLPFQTAARNKIELLSLVQSTLQGTPLFSWQEVVADIAYQALTTMMPGSIVPFYLSDINPKKIYRETEFLFPSQDFSRSDDVPLHLGFIKGVIDLFFEHQGKYYLLDWKSNWLGPSIECYQIENLKAAMHEHDYGLQAKIYIEALRRYLKLFDKRPFGEIFGGAYYLFLRGIGPNTGILHVSL